MTTASNPANAGAGNSPAAPKTPPAAAQKVEAAKRVRRPMSAPVRRLETTGIPGFHLHWFREPNVSRAQEAGYAFVNCDEVGVNHRNVAQPSEMGSSADLSNRMTVQYGGDTLYLMKLPEELYKEDMSLLAERNIEIWQQIFRGEDIMGANGQPNPGDTQHRYVKEAQASGGDLARAKRATTPLFARKFK